MSGSYELYAEVLRRATGVKVARRSAGSSSPRGPSSCPTASPAGSRSERRTPRWTGSRSATRSASSPTSTTSCSGVSRRHLRTELDLVVTAQQVRSYKPDPAHFKECAHGGSAARRAGSTSAPDTTTDVAPLLKMNVPVIWVNRNGEKLEGARRPPRRSRTFARRRRSLAPADASAASRAIRRRGDGGAGARALCRRAPPRRAGPAAPARGLPNLLVIGGLKCGTTSLHHYLNLHPEIAMSRPKELNFFVEELNWPLGPRLVRRPLRRRRAGPGRDLAPLHEPAPLRRGRRADARGGRRARGSSTWSATRSTACSRTTSTTSAAATSDRPLAEALPTTQRLRGPQPLRLPARALPRRVRPRGDRDRPSEELKRRPAGDDAPRLRLPGRRRASPRQQFEREWETGTAKGGGRLPAHGPGGPPAGPASLDRNFDRLPERLRWLVERIVHDPGAGEAASPSCPRSFAPRGRVLRARRRAGRGDRRPQLRLASGAEPAHVR